MHQICLAVFEILHGGTHIAHIQKMPNVSLAPPTSAVLPKRRGAFITQKAPGSSNCQPMCGKLARRGPSVSRLSSARPEANQLFLNDIAGLELTILASCDVEGNCCTFVKSFKAFHLDFREVNKKIFAIFLRDEAITLIWVKPFNSTFCHANPLPYSTALPRRINQHANFSVLTSPLGSYHNYTPFDFNISANLLFVK
jgi:hypothetical protein